MNRKKPYIYKRFIAYIIDILIVTLLSGILTILFTDSTQYNKDTENLLNVTEKLAQKEITTEEYYKQYDEINYSLTKDSVNVTIITVVVTIIYFDIMSYFCHGITLGKYIMKLKIVSANGKELTILNYLLRSTIINSLISNILTTILVLYLSKETFISVYPKISNAFTLLLIVTFIFMMYRDDGRGLHDIIGNTKIISTKEKDLQEIESEVK